MSPNFQLMFFRLGKQVDDDSACDICHRHRELPTLLPAKWTSAKSNADFQMRQSFCQRSVYLPVRWLLIQAVELVKHGSALGSRTSQHPGLFRFVLLEASDVAIHEEGWMLGESRGSREMYGELLLVTFDRLNNVLDFDLERFSVQRVL